MAKKLRVLILDNHPDDAERLVQELRRAGFDPDWQRADTVSDYITYLDPAPDLILADYPLPQWSGLHPLGALKEQGLDIPFIIVTEAPDEEAAIECLRQGAADYLLKDRLGRLGLAVANAIEQRELRQQKQRAEEALRESEERFRGAFDDAAIGMALTGTDGRFLEVNRSLCETLGYSREQLVGTSFSDVTHPEDVATSLEAMRQILSGEAHSLQFEKRYIHKLGHVVWVRLSASLVRDAQGSPLNFVAQMEDITERKRLREQLIEAQKMEAVGQLAGGIAHEFNNLLTPMIGFAQLGMNQLALDHPVRDYLQEILRASERSATLTRQLLTFSRRQIFQPGVVNLNDLVSGIANMVQSLIGEGIELTCVLAPDLGMVNVDWGQTEQVLVNMAVNARDAMPQGGKLTIETANVTIDAGYVPLHSDLTPGRYVRVSVTDTGVGMEEEVKAHLFEPFFTTKEQGQGTGLGLSTCYGIVKQSGGEIRVQSEVGQGTTFEIYLRRVEGAITQGAESGELGELPRGGETVLLAEDEPLVRRLATQMLQQQGYRVLEAADGEEALRVAREHAGEEIHLLLTDVVMPQMGGKELADRLRAERPGIEVLFTSGYPDDTITQHGVLESGIAFLPKPFTPETIARKVRELLDASQHQR